MSSTTIKPVSNTRAAAFKPKPKEVKPKREIPFDSLVKLPEGDFEKLTTTLKNARNAGEKIRSGYGTITKDMNQLFEACKVRLGGDEELLKSLSLSEAMLVIYRDAETIDNMFGLGTYKETKTATHGGASTWRKPWSRVKIAAFGDQKAIKTPLERLTEAMRTAFNSNEVSYNKALAALNRIFGKG